MGRFGFHPPPRAAAFWLFFLSAHAENETPFVAFNKKLAP
jgi:hypothetical protein